MTPPNTDEYDIALRMPDLTHLWGQRVLRKAKPQPVQPKEPKQ